MIVRFVFLVAISNICIIFFYFPQLSDVIAFFVVVAISLLTCFFDFVTNADGGISIGWMSRKNSGESHCVNMFVRVCACACRVWSAEPNGSSTRSHCCEERKGKKSARCIHDGWIRSSSSLSKWHTPIEWQSEERKASASAVYRSVRDN